MFCEIDYSICGNEKILCVEVFLKNVCLFKNILILNVRLDKIVGKNDDPKIG